MQRRSLILGLREWLANLLRSWLARLEPAPVAAAPLVDQASLAALRAAPGDPFPAELTLDGYGPAEGATHVWPFSLEDTLAGLGGDVEVSRPEPEVRFVMVQPQELNPASGWAVYYDRKTGASLHAHQADYAGSVRYNGTETPFQVGDYLTKGADGVRRPLAREVFEATYIHADAFKQLIAS